MYLTVKRVFKQEGDSVRWEAVHHISHVPSQTVHVWAESAAKSKCSKNERAVVVRVSADVLLGAVWTLLPVLSGLGTSVEVKSHYC